MKMFSKYLFKIVFVSINEWIIGHSLSPKDNAKNYLTYSTGCLCVYFRHHQWSKCFFGSKQRISWKRSVTSIFTLRSTDIILPVLMSFPLREFLFNVLKFFLILDLYIKNIRWLRPSNFNLTSLEAVEIKGRWLKNCLSPSFEKLCGGFPCDSDAKLKKKISYSFFSW